MKYVFLSHVYLNTSHLLKYSSPEERDARLTVFQESLEDIDKLNAAERAYGGTAVFGITVMSDLSPTEFESQHLLTLRHKIYENNFQNCKIANVPAYQGSATSVDWTGILTTPVKNQVDHGWGW